MYLVFNKYLNIYNKIFKTFVVLNFRQNSIYNYAKKYAFNMIYNKFHRMQKDLEENFSFLGL